MLYLKHGSSIIPADNCCLYLQQMKIHQKVPITLYLSSGGFPSAAVWHVVYLNIQITLQTVQDASLQDGVQYVQMWTNMSSVQVFFIWNVYFVVISGVQCCWHRFSSQLADDKCDVSNSRSLLNTTWSQLGSENLVILLVWWQTDNFFYFNIVENSDNSWENLIINVQKKS